MRGGIWRGVLGAGEWGADRVNTLAATAATAAAAQREREKWLEVGANGQTITLFSYYQPSLILDTA